MLETWLTVKKYSFSILCGYFRTSLARDEWDVLWYYPSVPCGVMPETTLPKIKKMNK